MSLKSIIMKKMQSMQTLLAEAQRNAAVPPLVLSPPPPPAVPDGGWMYESLDWMLDPRGYDPDKNPGPQWYTPEELPPSWPG
jgi:hypothetical protein